jgi:hypothetical protein
MQIAHEIARVTRPLLLSFRFSFGVGGGGGGGGGGIQKEEDATTTTFPTSL